MQIEILKKACMCRAFEEEAFKAIKYGQIETFTYLSAGEEFIPAYFSELYKDLKPYIFAQHRCHSWYLSFGGPVRPLINELMGLSSGICHGKGGSASIHCPDIKMIGHDGLLGSNCPIAVGHAYVTKEPTICVLGDAAIEEDYVISSILWASSKNLPILFIVVDNGLSILSPIKTRRNWDEVKLFENVLYQTYTIADNYLYNNAYLNLDFGSFSHTRLINIKTNRLWYHVGAGVDDPYKEDLLIKAISSIKNGDKIYEDAKNEMQKIWKH
jgi:hypothetical protein